MDVVLINWAVALAPVLLLLLVFEWLDVFHLIHIREVLVLLTLGVVAGLVSYPISGRLLDAMPIGFSNYSRFVAPWIEESLKAAIVIWLFSRNRIGFKLDAAISGFAIGAGFSVVENILYLLRFAQLDVGVWIVRGFGTAIMHGTAAALFAAFAHQFNEHAARQPAAAWHLRPLLYLPGLLAAVAVHTAFNLCASQPLYAMLGIMLLLPCFIWGVFRYGEIEARSWLNEEEVNHRAALAELRSGSFPQTGSGQLVARLAERANGRASSEMIRDYLEVHTALVLHAEEMLHHIANGHAARPPEADLPLFVRFEAIKDQLGRTTLAMIAPLLPFTREELWELSELKHRLVNGSRGHVPGPAG
jgi:protease PrsW